MSRPISADQIRYDGALIPTTPRYPMSEADVIALTAAAGLNGGAGLTPTLIAVAYGNRFKDMSAGGNDMLPAGVSLADRWRPGLLPWLASPGRSVLFVEGASSRLEVASNAFFDVGGATAADNLLLVGDYCSIATTGDNYVISKDQNPPSYTLTVTAAGELNFGLWSAGIVNVTTAGAALRDGDVHCLGAMLDFSLAAANQVRCAAERANTAVGSMVGVGTLVNTGVLSLGADAAGAATHQFSTSAWYGFRGAQLSGVSIKAVMAALGWVTSGV